MVKLRGCVRWLCSTVGKCRAALAQMMAEYSVMRAWGQVNWRELLKEVTTLFAKAFTWQHLAKI